ncbi:hypothetical protein PR202_ga04305 [Eleusine coracana subsp. coracana]|uniref:Subtilisin-like protease fibronectin type-III domain-containing protein n=1 Tax=Eleusine coracana subsp. coracana TaxID=191504 RepID=A0AAV5BRG6_ELECO|nr:hypothetical protein PR202_ga04305 [Eleusine coracana subsp. coracana]
MSNPKKAAEPGLVYDVSPGDYIGYLCGLYTSQEVSMIARQVVNCSDVTVIPESMLNYPSISVVFQQTSNQDEPVVVQRKVKNVGNKVPWVYVPMVDMPPDEDVTIDVSPRELVFTQVNQEQSFNVTIWPRQNGARLVQGAIRWVSGTSTVRSAITISFA